MDAPLTITPLPPIVRVFPAPDALFAAAAARVAELSRDAISRRGRFSIALSGGSTPGGLYRVLAARFRDTIDWARVHVWWSDERCVPHDDPRSNTRSAREALLDHIPIPASGVHPVPTDLPPADAAQAYERALRSFDPRSPIDLTLLGMGADGHTASLFPAEPALNEQARWIVHVHAPASSPVRDRVSFTLPLIAASRHALFMVTGADKRPQIIRALAPPAADTPPAGRVRAQAPVEWFLDSAAAPTA